MAADVQALNGEASFRLMPTDEFHTGQTWATITEFCTDQYAIRYSWEHPKDGEQHGELLLGAAHTEDGSITAGWVDTWHQKPHLQVFDGSTSADAILLRANYGGEWEWQIELAGLGTGTPVMTFRNVIPEAVLAAQPPGPNPVSTGPYDVSVFSWRSASGGESTPPSNKLRKAKNFSPHTPNRIRFRV